MPIRKLHLTTMKMNFPWTSSTRVVRKAWTEEKVDDQWKASKWCARVNARNIVRKQYNFSFDKLVLLLFLHLMIRSMVMMRCDIAIAESVLSF